MRSRLPNTEASHESTTSPKATTGHSCASKNARHGHHLVYQHLCDDGAAGVGLEDNHGGGAVNVGTVTALETVVTSIGKLGEDADGHDVRAKLISKEKHEKMKYFSFNGVAAGSIEDGTTIGVISHGRASCGDGVTGTTELRSPPSSMKTGYTTGYATGSEEQEGLGLCGSNGLLSTPNVKMMLLRVGVVQVRAGSES